MQGLGNNGETEWKYKMEATICFFGFRAESLGFCVKVSKTSVLRFDLGGLWVTIQE